MDGYYKQVNTTLRGGAPADVRKINDIQESTDSGISSAVADIEGSAVCLSSEQDALVLEAPGRLIDLQNIAEVGWQTLEDLPVRRMLDINKNGIKKIETIFRNDTPDTVQFVCKLYGAEYEDDYSVIPVKTILIDVPHTSTSGNTYSIEFASEHLNNHYHWWVIERTDTEGTFVRTATPTANVFGGETLEVARKFETSPDKIEWQEGEADLYFKEYYANDMTYDIVNAVVLILGRKLKNFDTHVDIPPASSVAPRKDYVYLDRNGWVLVKEGQPATKPILPTIGRDKLGIAYVSVPANATSISQLTLNQDDNFILGGRRRRSLVEYIRRLLRRDNYWNKYYKPRQVTVERTTGFLNAGESINIGWVNDHYEIVSHTKETFKHNLNTMTGINDEQTTLDVDTVDKQAYLDTVTTVTYDWRVNPPSGKKHIAEAQGKYFVSTRSQSKFLYSVFIPKITTKFTKLSLLLGHIVNVQHVRLRLINYSTNTLVAQSNNLKEVNYNNVPRGQAAWQTFTFPQELTMKKGQKYRIIIDAVPKTGKTAEIYAPAYDDDYASDFKMHVEHRYLTYPHRIGYIDPDYVDYMKYYIPIMVDRGSKTMYEKNGVIESENISTGGKAIKQVVADVNVRLNKGESYELWVSNNAGANWYKMTSNKYTFQNPSGAGFKWRIKLITQDQDTTPEIYYDSKDGYAVKFDVTYTEASADSGTGTLYTIHFDGDRIINDYLSSGEFGGSVFSHYAWILTQLDPKGGQISIDIQVMTSEWYDQKQSYSVNDRVIYLDGSTIKEYKCIQVNVATAPKLPTDTAYWTQVSNTFRNWKTGLVPGVSGFLNTDPEYHDYDEEYDDDRFNFYCDFENNRGLYFPLMRLAIHLTRENPDDYHSKSPEVHMVGAIVEAV